jgi:hypothetical protein
MRSTRAHAEQDPSRIDRCGEALGLSEPSACAWRTRRSSCIRRPPQKALPAYVTSIKKL